VPGPEHCCLELNSTLKENGFLLSKTTTLAMAQKGLISGADEYATFINKLKRAIDPNNIQPR
jgi:hypothetical protein